MKISPPHGNEELVAPLRDVVAFSKDSSVLESFWLTVGNLHFNKDLQFCFMEDFDVV